MKIEELLQEVEVVEARGPAGVEVRELAYSAADVKPGACFVALRGTSHDGHDFAAEAVTRGAVAVVSERRLPLGAGVANLVVRDARLALGHMSARLCGDPSGTLALIGVTGTNGKTTTTYLLESILRAAGRQPGVIGTVEYRYAGRRLPAPHTTPQSLDLQRLLRQMREAGCDSCAMEVSSHALSQERVAGCRFDVGIFTNLTPEHLDYHRNMEGYFAAKAILFERILAEGGKANAAAAINADDPYGRELARRSEVPAVLYGLEGGTAVTGAGLRADAAGIRMRVATPAGSFDCRSPLCGRFNAHNILGAVAAAVQLGVALVDDAHTPNALEKALTHARELAGGGRLIAVFGCGGDRDRGKRPLMGRAAARLADLVIVTSDNPRTESPEAIVEQILPGVREFANASDGERGYEVIVDREEAIARAVAIARAGDVLVVAGKGHEDYQIIGKRKRHFDDREVLADLLQA
jgi:UDP-N-acetylmuramoyl-L-alanyl-D-glutamate--2,6-diaminopimelate ligase